MLLRNQSTQKSLVAACRVDNGLVSFVKKIRVCFYPTPPPIAPIALGGICYLEGILSASELVPGARCDQAYKAEREEGKREQGVLCPGQFRLWHKTRSLPC